MSDCNQEKTRPSSKKKQMMQNEGAMSRFQQLPSDQGSRHPEVSQVEFRSFSFQF
jgi:hypothetical protein